LNPLVAGGHQVGKVVIGDDLGRYVMADAKNR